MKKVSVKELKTALLSINYHKVDLFIERCLIEEDKIEEDESKLSAETIKDIAWSMLDIDLEKRLLSNLGIS